MGALIVDAGPAVVGPGEAAEGEGGGAVAGAVVEVDGEPLVAGVLDHGGVAGADEVALRSEDEASATFAKIAAGVVEVGAGDGARASDEDAVGAVLAAAAEAFVEEQVIITAASIERRRLDFLRPGE